ncbi:hypothetical protein K431DRAFT_288492 [Polychaeton citri CBS 116435]|uniref:Uncharacterized protein n=1 Tax=Polychaeton citri CBS 116435 TaxID=1314669 RepID=A0A9P4Q0L4_9PEZI|nr:hypothetical protein K431DRAFT_288492 [Polychaeton citri CBS 116435]
MSSSEDDVDSVDRETSGSPTPPPQSVSIQQAIEDAPPAELRRIVQNLWAGLPQARTVIDATLRRPLGNSSSLKRKAFEECKNCHETYDVEENEMGVCRYHPLEQEVDDESDVWADHDPDCHGDPSDPSLMEDPTYADGYIMSCCEKAPYQPGCVISRHKPNTNSQQAKKAKG